MNLDHQLQDLKKNADATILKDVVFSTAMEKRIHKSVKQHTLGSKRKWLLTVVMVAGLAAFAIVSKDQLSPLIDGNLIKPNPPTGTTTGPDYATANLPKEVAAQYEKYQDVIKAIQIKYAPYDDIEVAKKDRYTQSTGFVPMMGYSFVNPYLETKDKVFILGKEDPNTLLYVNENGKYKMVGAGWRTSNPKQPQLFDEAKWMIYQKAAARYADGTELPSPSPDKSLPKNPITGAPILSGDEGWHPDIYGFNIWFKDPNPNGLFTDTNPNLARYTESTIEDTLLTVYSTPLGSTYAEVKMKYPNLGPIGPEGGMDSLGEQGLTQATMDIDLFGKKGTLEFNFKDNKFYSNIFTLKGLDQATSKDLNKRLHEYYSLYFGAGRNSKNTEEGYSSENSSWSTDKFELNITNNGYGNGSILSWGFQVKQ